MLKRVTQNGKFLKYAIRKFTIIYSKTKAKNSHENKLHLENKFKILEQNGNLQNDKTEYDICKQELNTIYDEISARIKIRRRCDCMNLEKNLIIFFKLRKAPCLPHKIRLKHSSVKNKKLLIFIKLNHGKLLQKLVSGQNSEYYA